MINQNLQLVGDVFDTDKLAMQATRDGFGEAIMELAAEDDRVVAFCADVTESVRLQPFKEKYPERYIEMGVAEQNMAAVASGLANYGKLPFIVTYAAFSPGRNWEQIRTTIALSDLPVKIMGMHTGVSVGADGATHQMLEDITLMRVLPNMQLLVPSDKEEARKAVLAAAKNDKPTYIRFTRHNSPVYTNTVTPFEIGKAEYLYRSQEPKVAILGAGPLLYDALVAARRLEVEGIGTSVLNLHTIRPMDIQKVIEAARETRAVVTVEEHQILGGVGGTVAEVLAQNVPTPQEMVAVHDQFGQSGTADELYRHYGLNADAIVEAARRAHTRRNS